MFSTLVWKEWKQACRPLNVGISHYFFGPGWVGKTTFLPHSGGAGWIVNPATGKRLRFFPPAVASITYDQAGERFAIMTDGTRYGSRNQSLRIETYHAQGEQIGMPVPVPREFWGWQSLFFRNHRLYVVGHEAIHEVDCERGELESVVKLPKQKRNHIVIQARDTSELFLVLQTDRLPEKAITDDDSGLENSNYTGLFPLDLETGTIAENPVVVDPNSIWGMRKRLSPDGRFWRRPSAEGTAQLSIVEIATGEETQLSEQLKPFRSTWLSGDRIAWLESSTENLESPEETRTLLTWAPGKESAVVRDWEPGTRVWIEAEPRGHRLLVSTATGELGSFQISLEVYDPRTGEWLSLPSQVDQGRPVFRGSWIGTSAVGMSIRGSDDTYTIDLDRGNLISPL